MEASEYLGGEFLVWLHWRVMEADGEIDLSGSGAEVAPDGCRRVSVSFSRSVTLIDPVESETVTVKMGNPAGSPEVLHALRQGKVFGAARLDLAWLTPSGESREYGASVKAATLGLSGVVAPVLMDVDDDPVQRIIEETWLMAELDALVLALFRTFLDIRLSDQWADDLAGIRRSIEEDEQHA